MRLSIRQKSNIRHFAFYLVNGTLDFSLLNGKLNQNFHEHLKSVPDVFFKTCCVFINQEVKLSPDWPLVRRLAEYICSCLDPEEFKEFENFEPWETDASFNDLSISSCFKRFSLWFTEVVIGESFGYCDFIDSGASFVEQCFAIWANVVDAEDGVVINHDYCVGRVLVYMNSYFSVEGEESSDVMEDWECELYMV